MIITIKNLQKMSSSFSKLSGYPLPILAALWAAKNYQLLEEVLEPSAVEYRAAQDKIFMDFLTRTGQTIETVKGPADSDQQYVKDSEENRQKWLSLELNMNLLTIRHEEFRGVLLEPSTLKYICHLVE